MHEQHTAKSQRFASPEIAAAYLAAMIDGEGYVSFTRETTGYIRRLVAVCNTEIELIEAVEDALTMLGVGFRRTSWQPKIKGNKRAMRVQVGRPFDLRRLAASITLQSPRKQAALVAAAAHRGKAERLPLHERPLSEVRRLYEEEHLSARMVADRVGVNEATVYKWLSEAGCAIRTRSEARAIAVRRRVR